MLTWLLRLLGIVAREVACLFCKRAIGEKQAASAGWLKTAAGWICGECQSEVLRAGSKFRATR